MSSLGFAGISEIGIGPLTLHWHDGLHVLVGVAGALALLADVAAGSRRPRRGQVLVDGAPLDAPEQRRKLGSLLANEELIPAPTVELSMHTALVLRKVPLDASTLLDSVGLRYLATRHPARLSDLERRSVALSLALHDPASTVLLLHDPLSCASLVPRAFILERCAARARSACVVVFTPELADALALGGTLLRLERGRVLRTAADGSVSASGCEVHVRCNEAAQLARALSADARVQSVVFDRERSPCELVVHGSELESLANAVAELAEQESVAIVSLAPSLFWQADARRNAVRSAAGSAAGAPR